MTRWALSLAVVGMLLAAGGVSAAALIDGGDVKNGSLTGKDVKNKSLTKRDIRGRLRGPRGFTGPRGPAGPTVVNRISTYTGSLTVAPGGIEILSVDCPTGYAVVSGGWTIIGGDTTPFVDKTYDDTSWSVGIDNFNSSVDADAEVYAHCAPAGQAVAARVSHRSNLVRTDEARQRAADAG